MRPAVFLSLWPLVIVTFTVTSWYGNYHLAEATTSFWSIDNQMKVEERPYTAPENIADRSVPLDRSKVNKRLEPSLREMQRYCDGQCFYAPATCNHTKYNCNLLLSVAMHNSDKKGEIYCDHFGRNNLKESFCYNSHAQRTYRRDSGKVDRFFTITLHRNLGGKIPTEKPSSSCPKRWKLELGRNCRRTEFVAVSFVKGGNRNPNTNTTNTTSTTNTTRQLDIDDLWYVCTIDENSYSRVTMWALSDDPKKPPRQLHNTRPHKSSGMGVVFSKIVMNEDIASMGCQFVIQESNMSLYGAPINTAYFGEPSHLPITVKLAEGYVDRDEDNRDVVLRPFHNDGTQDFSYYKIYEETDIKPRDDIIFDQLEVKLMNASLDYEFDVKTENISNIKMEELVRKCDKPDRYPDLYIACYPPNNQPNCIHTGRCPVMFVVEVPKSDKSFKRIKAHVYGVIPDSTGLRKARRPMGYAAIGLSKDDRMGRDVVIVCHADGMNNVRVHVSINYLNANIYPGKVSYDHLLKKNVTYGSAEKSKILCSWEMKTHLVVNMLSYEPDYHDSISSGVSEKLEFDFTKENVHLLVAAGNRNYPGGKIVRHDFSQVLKELFSKDLFFRKASGSINSHSLLVNILLLTSYYFANLYLLYIEI